MMSDEITEYLDFPFLPEEVLVERLRSHGHDVFDLRKDPTTAAKYVIELNAVDGYITKVDALAIASLGIIAFYNAPTKHVVIQKTDWRPHDSLRSGE